MINIKRKIVLAVFILGLVVLLIYLRFFNNPQQNLTSDPTNSSAQITKNDKPQIISTIPDPLDETIIPADQIIEISFNKSLQNAPEFKVRIEPKIDFKVELSGDRKTAKIIPSKPYELGTTYTLFIGTETKFDGAGRWGEEKVFHFRTIRYRGI